VIELHTLTDGGQQPIEVARLLAGFLGEARQTLDLALYDIRLTGEVADTVRGALEEAGRRGVTIRLAYNVDHGAPIPVPAPPQTRPELIEALPFDTRGIAGVPDLMHHKYVLRDGAGLWTGSTNWTDDSWSREENVIVTVDSPELVQRFALDFEQLWSTGDVAKSGRVEPNPVRVDGKRVRAWFSPGFGEELAERVGHALHKAKRRIRIASPVITSGPVLGTLAEIASDGKVDLAGVVDVTQIEEVLRQWEANGNVGWKEPALRRSLLGAPFSGKRSTPYGPGTVHDYMHAKVVVADDLVFCGSYNLSHSGERNAENVLEIEDEALADQLATYVDAVRARYPAVELPPAQAPVSAPPGQIA
jgi:phosphatidylserine/phosphatidylglycerophosphate/cardiolipin synthase-like enzyme